MLRDDDSVRIPPLCVGSARLLLGLVCQTLAVGSGYSEEELAALREIESRLAGALGEAGGSR
jgi:hypothetical protein